MLFGVTNLSGWLFGARDCSRDCLRYKHFEFGPSILKMEEKIQDGLNVKWPHFHGTVHVEVKLPLRCSKHGALNTCGRVTLYLGTVWK